MKFSALVSAVLFLACISANAQDFYTPEATPSGLSKGTITFNMGIYTDNFRSVSLEDMMNIAENPEQVERDLSGLEASPRASATGGAFNLNYRFDPNPVNTGSVDTEVSVGVTVQKEKEAMLSYQNKDIDTSIVYCSIHKEMGIEAAYLLTGTFGDHVFWNAGVGASGGMTYDNSLLVLTGRYFGPDEHPSSQEEIQMESFEAKPMYYGRAYIQHGIGFLAGKHWALGMNFKNGFGVQKIKGGNTNPFTHTSLSMISVGFKL
jgi:hypothetical protein